MKSQPAVTPRTRVRRHPERASYDRAVVNRVLDEGLICHLGFVVDGVPWVVPTMYARAGEVLYVHGSPASRMLQAAGSGAEICVTVTLLDGLVLARSAFNHSMNYRSVMLVGRPEPVTEIQEKMAAFQALVEHVVRGRWEHVRATTAKELKATTVLRLAIGEASCKLREGGPGDTREDAQLPIWAGVIPLQLAAGPAIPAPDLPPQLALPAHVLGYRR
ncbi:MAG: pyridoxamine 5'-phosphate oxidase family protein [Candidatus Dormibacteraeota bacterium]|nr:pyridoxamine 5'-phosphate oxidase family protein [Candidatus Dormibacteraeota bacterium]